jgi:hypothetical protein
MPATMPCRAIAMSSESRSNPGCFYIGYFCWIDSASRTKITYICWTELEQLALWNIEREDWRLGQSLTLSYSCLALGILGGRLAALAIGHLEALFGSKKLQGKCKCVFYVLYKNRRNLFFGFICLLTDKLTVGLLKFFRRWRSLGLFFTVKCD